MPCTCGNPLHEERVTVQWTDANATEYTIRNVPRLTCTTPNCDESYYPGDVEFSLAVLADEMEQGLLPRETEYEQRL